MPRFYRFLRWTPFLHNIEAGRLPCSQVAGAYLQGFKIIAYGTNLNHRLGYHFGILFALIGVELIFYPLALVFERWKQDRRAKREQSEEEKES